MHPPLCGGISLKAAFHAAPDHEAEMEDCERVFPTNPCWIKGANGVRVPRVRAAPPQFVNKRVLPQSNW